MPMIRAGEAPSWEQPGWMMLGLAAPSRGSKELALWRVRIDPDTDGPLHRVDHEIAFIVLKGAAAITVDGETVDVLAGDAFVIPAGSERKLGNRQSEPCELVNAMPAGAKSERVDGSKSSIPWAL